MILGEAIHDLHSALEQAIYQLTIDWHGAALEMTGFPVISDPNKWNVVELLPGDQGLTVSGARFLPTYMNRANRMVVPLAQAHEALGREHGDTNVDEQLQRVTAILNELTPVEVALAA